MSTYKLDRLLAPRSVAVVGASPRRGSLGAAVLANLRGAGFPGKIGSSIRSIARSRLPAVPSLSQLSFVPDLVGHHGACRDDRSDMWRGRTGGAAAAASSSARGSATARVRFAAEAEAARARPHMRLIGPNCLGVIVPRAKLNASFAAQAALPATSR